MDYGKAVRTCRALRGLQQEEVATRSGLSKSFVSLIESGRRTPSAQTVTKLARGLRVPAALLTLLASDLDSLPPVESSAFDQLARSLLALVIRIPDAKEENKLQPDLGF